MATKKKSTQKTIELTNEETVKEKYPDAELIEFNGKFHIIGGENESGEVTFSGPIKDNSEDAWKIAAHKVLVG